MAGYSYAEAPKKKTKSGLEWIVDWFRTSDDRKTEKGLNKHFAKQAVYDKVSAQVDKELAAAELIKNTTTAPVQKVSTGGAGSGGGTGLTETPLAKMTGDEIAAMFNIVNKKEDILTSLNKGTDAKYKEYTNQATKIKEEAARTMNSQYENYLNSLRDSRANALSTGILKGTANANNIKTLLGSQQTGAQSQQSMYDTLLGIEDRKSSELYGNDALALEKSNAINAELGKISNDYYGSDINKYSTDVGARTSLASARIGAGASVAAANAGVNANDWLLNLLQKTYGSVDAGNNAYVKMMERSYGSSAV